MTWREGLAYLVLIFAGALVVTAVLIALTSKGSGPE